MREHNGNRKQLRAPDSRFPPFRFPFPLSRFPLVRSHPARN